MPALVVLLARMPLVLAEPALWPDDLNYLIHVCENPGRPVWHYVNLAGVEGLRVAAADAGGMGLGEPGAVAGLDALSVRRLQPGALRTGPGAAAHPMSQAVLPTALQRRLACLPLILLPVSSVGQATAVAIQHVTFLMIAAWLVVVHAGPNPWTERLSRTGVAALLATLLLAMWSAPTAFALCLPALAGLAWAWRDGRLRSRVLPGPGGGDPIGHWLPVARRGPRCVVPA